MPDIGPDAQENDRDGELPDLDRHDCSTESEYLTALRRDKTWPSLV